MQMMLSVLSAACKGDTANLGIEINKTVPFIRIDNIMFLKSSARVMLRSYFSMTNYISEIPGILSGIKDPLEQYAKSAEKYTRRVSQMTLEQNYSIIDQLEAIRISEINYEIITRAPDERRSLEKVVVKTLKLMHKSFQSSLTPHHADIIVSRGLQAHAERLNRPKSIVQKFWPNIE